MGDKSPNRPSAAKISTSESPTKDSRLVDSVSNGWTDEKHVLFLNSIEADFVNDLYNDQYHSKAFLGWLSSMKEHKESNENILKSNKVSSMGCCENLKIGRESSRAEIENDSVPLYANPWIQHFRAPSTVRNRFLNSSKKRDDIEFFRSSVQPSREMIDGESTSSKHIFKQDSIGFSTEVSDQNFIPDEPIVCKKSSRTSRKRKLRDALVREPINDQVVPSRETLVTASCKENTACGRTINEGSSAIMPEEFPGFLPAET